MRAFHIILCAALANAKPQGSATGADGKIVGGEEAPLHEFPWQISLRNLGSHLCGGIIINQNQVITAAHCVLEGTFPALDTVVAGAHHRILEGGHQKRRIKSMEPHEDWNTPHFSNDIALITVKEPFDFTDPNVQPIDMFLSTDTDISDETICNSTGWGQTSGVSSGVFPNALQWAQIPIRTGEECADIFNYYLDDRMICAGSVGHNTCIGDAGGPLVCPDENGNGKLAGIISFSHNRCEEAGIFTKVSKYEDWITPRLYP